MWSLSLKISYCTVCAHLFPEGGVSRLLSGMSELATSLLTDFGAIVK